MIWNYIIVSNIQSVRKNAENNSYIGMWTIKCDRVLRCFFFFFRFAVFLWFLYVSVLFFHIFWIPFYFESQNSPFANKNEDKYAKKRMYKSCRYYKTARIVKGDAKKCEYWRTERKKTGLKNVKLSTWEKWSSGRR